MDSAGTYSEGCCMLSSKKRGLPVSAHKWIQMMKLAGYHEYTVTSHCTVGDILELM